MKSTKILMCLGISVTVVFLFAVAGIARPLFPYFEGTEVKPGTHAPKITHSFAVEKGYYGYIWKIFIEADDPDGDMALIATVVNQGGYGHYPTDWLRVRHQYQKKFRGYIQWITFSSRASYLKEWTYLTLKVSVIDRAGNESNVVIFPFTFESGIGDPYKYKLPAPFDQGDPRLGYVHIDLLDPWQN